MDLPFTVPGNFGDVCAAWLVVDRRLAKGPELVVTSDQLQPCVLPPLTRPDIKRSTVTVLPLPEGFEAGGRGESIIRISCVGAPIFTDRKLTILTLPKELDGAPGISFSATQGKESSRLAFTAKRPVRVYIAFGPVNPSDQWLDPQPGWQLFKKDAFTCTDRYVGKDIYFKDFGAGPVELFSGEKGNYVVLGIMPKP